MRMADGTSADVDRFESVRGRGDPLNPLGAR